MNKLEDARLRGRRFAAARAARGLTQHELGKRVGATQSLITQIERGLVERSKFDALIMYELGLPLDEETVRFILAARQARNCPPVSTFTEADARAVALPSATYALPKGTHTGATHLACSPPPCGEGLGVGVPIETTLATTPLPNPPPQVG